MGRKVRRGGSGVVGGRDGDQRDRRRSLGQVRVLIGLAFDASEVLFLDKLLNALLDHWDRRGEPRTGLLDNFGN